MNMEKAKNREVKLLYVLVAAMFVLFLLIPVLFLMAKSFQNDNGINLNNYMVIVGESRFYKAVFNSITIAVTSAILSTFCAFILAYTVNFTNISLRIRKTIKMLAVMPMLLPTITYGFAIIYSFGKQGLISKLLGMQLFDIYGFNGLLLGYFIYTLPIAFILINNTMAYIDKKFLIVSRMMGDKKAKSLFVTVIRPLSGTLTASVIQCFFLSFTDYGIPASVGGQYEVVSTLLYNQMLGSVPNFQSGAVISMVMLIPSMISISLLCYIERYNITYNKISDIEIQKGSMRDVICTLVSILIFVCMLSPIAVIFMIPFVQEWPYDITFTFGNMQAVFTDKALVDVFKNSLLVSLFTAVFGTMIAYISGLITARSDINNKFKKTIESAALVTNTIPGMVLGIAFLLVFSGTGIQNTFFIIIICNIIHFFSTPYLMMKSSLEKMNQSWETTAFLMGDTWLKTVARIITPNALTTILEAFEYYFINSMVTVSAVIFLIGAKTTVITAKIKELQHFAKFNEIFVLSVMIFLTNLAVKLLVKAIQKRKGKQL